MTDAMIRLECLRLAHEEMRVGTVGLDQVKARANEYLAYVLDDTRYLENLDMASIATDRLAGVTAGLASKAPVRAATTANITLSGEQTIDGVAVVADNRVLVKNQTDGIENGVYDVKSGAWVRSWDFDGVRDIVSGTFVVVTSGSTNSITAWQISTADPITIGTTSIAFVASVWSSAAGVNVIATGGTTALTLADWFNATVDVRTFGATGDGTTDDTAAIQAAIDYAHVSSNFDNKAVYLPTPAVSYKITSTLDLYQRVALIGEDKWNCRIAVSGQILGVQNPRLVTGIWFDGGSISNGANKIHEAGWTAAADRANTAIVLGPSDLSTQGGHAIIEQCRFTFFGVAIESGDCINPTIDSCYFSDNHHDIYFRATGALEFASLIKETKNYHAGGQGVGCGFYVNTNGYVGYDNSGSIYENLCKTETTMGFIDSAAATVRQAGGNSVYFEVGDTATYPSQIAIRMPLYHGENHYFKGFDKVFASPTTLEVWNLSNSDIVDPQGTYDFVLTLASASSGCIFEKVAFANGLDPANPGRVVLINCGNDGLSPDNGSNIYMTTGLARFNKISTGIVTFTSTDATPTVAGGNNFITAGTTAITDFDDGVVGQTITIKATANITITNGAPIVLNGAVNYAMTDTDTLTLTMFVDQVWSEVARSVN